MELKISNRIANQVRIDLREKTSRSYSFLLLGYVFSLLRNKIIVIDTRPKCKLQNIINNDNL